MAENVCPQCGAPVTPGASECKFCGEKLVVSQSIPNAQQVSPHPQVVYTQQPQSQVNVQSMPQQVYVSGINPVWPVKSKIVAGLLGILLGGIGIHKFYMGKIGMGILYLLFCWTGIPAVIGLIEGIVYLCSSDENFQLKNHVRIG